MLMTGNFITPNSQHTFLLEYSGDPVLIEGCQSYQFILIGFHFINPIKER